MMGQLGAAVSNAGIRLRSQTRELAAVGLWPIKLSPRAALPGILVCVGYYVGALIGLALTFHPFPVAVMWPPNSVLLAALLLSPTRRWFWLLVCALPAHLVAELQGDVPLRMVLCWFVSNAGDAVIGAGSVRLLIGPSVRFDRVKTIGVMFVCGALLGPFLSSFLDSAFVSLNHFGDQTYWRVWRMRFCSNVFTSLTLMPVIVTWGTRPPRFWRRAELLRVFEAGILAVGLLTVSFIVFCWQETGPARNPLLLYAPLPFLLWAAVRFSPSGTSSAILSVALLSIWGAVHGRGPFASHSPERNALSIQAFFTVVSTAFMFLAGSIAERRRAEERFATVFRSSPDAMILSRLHDGRILEVNERWEKMFGYRRAETLGRTVFELSIYASTTDREQLVARATSAEGLHGVELCLRTRTGEPLLVAISGDTDHIGDEHCLIMVIRDISDRKRAEEAQQILAHASRLAVVGELTAMVAHEVNQPLGAILSNADAAEMLLDSETPPLDEVRQILIDIRKDDLRAHEAIRRMRALLRKREIQLEPVDLNATVSDVLHLVTGDALRRRIQIQADLTPGLPPAVGDRVHLQQVLLNLIVNGMDAMDGVPEADRRITVRTQRNGPGGFVVAVEDRGHGIPGNDLPRIFESFFTTKQEGMGLGLSIARSIVEAHRGRIWAENNQKGGGATFRFTLEAV